MLSRNRWTGRAVLLGIAGLIAVPLLAAPQDSSDEGPDTSGPVVMRGEYQGLSWWVVDPDSHVTAFYGGDIQSICRSDPNIFGAVEGFSYVRYQIVDSESDKHLLSDLERGKDVGASLWDGPPPFRVPQLCADILSRDPIAVGTAHIKLNVINVRSSPGETAKGRSVITFSGQGSMQKQSGESVKVKSTSNCSWPANESINTVYGCKSSVTVH